MVRCPSAIPQPFQLRIDQVIWFGASKPQIKDMVFSYFHVSQSATLPEKPASKQ
jgi:hypothetical protein